MASRKHAEMIKKWLDNPDCEVWFIDVNHGKEWRKVTGNPLWGQGDRYVVVLPEYKEAWQAYLDDELETKFEYEDEWHGWGREYVVPMFSSPPECYRRQPRPTVQMKVVFMDNGYEQSYPVVGFGDPPRVGLTNLELTGKVLSPIHGSIIGDIDIKITEAKDHKKGPTP